MGESEKNVINGHSTDAISAEKCFPTQVPGSSPLKKILFIHGAWHGAWCWDIFVKYFNSQGYDCHTLTFRGHDTPGNRGRKMNRHSIADYVQDVVQAVENIREDSSEKDEEIILVGHSMGGMVVQKYLEKYPCSKAVLLASVPPSGVFGPIMRYMRAKTKAALKSLSTANAYLLLDTPDKVKWAFFSNDTPDDVIDGYARRLSSESYLAFFNMMFPRIRVRYHRQVPILVLGAQEDNMFSVEEVRETAKKYDAVCHIFPDVAHDMMIDKNPLKIAEFMKNWLEDGRLKS